MSDGVNRRDFLKILGIGAATAAAGCAPGGKPEKIIPYLIPPDDIVPGIAQYYATTCTECPAGCGVTARTREGRATKLEGLPDHPINRGRLCARGHSALQALYNPDRLAGPQMRNGSAWKTVKWNEAIATLGGKLRESRGRVALLTGHVTGSMNALLGDVAAATGARRVSYEAFGHEAIRAANALTFGVNGIPRYDIGAAKYVLSFGADFLETWLSPVEFARGFREHHSAQGTQMGTFVFIAPRLSLTGMNADEWVAIAPGTEGVLALAMVRVMVDEGLGGASGNAALRAASSHFDVRAASEKTGVAADRIQRLAREFAQSGAPLALVGGTATASTQGTQTAAAVNLLNYAAGAIGRTVLFGPMHSLSSLGSYKDVMDLVAAMNAGEVQTLIIADTNPAYSLPTGSGFVDALKKVPFSAVLSPTMTDTAALASLVLPTHHALESWGDAEPQDGVFSLIQPVMRPVPVTTPGPTLGTPRFDTKPAGDVLIETAKAIDPAAAAQFTAASYEDYVKARWRTIHAAHGGGMSFEAFWAQAVERGGVFASVTPRSVSLAAGAASVNVNAPAMENASAGFTLLPYASATLYDGRFADRPWLQEQPDPVTKIVWDSWVEMHPNTAKKLGVDRGDLVALDTGHGTVTVAAFPYPGIREDVLAIPTGQGHTSFGRYAADGDTPRGVNVAAALPSAMDAASGGRAWLSTKVAASKAGGHHRLITTNGSDSQEDANVAQIIPLTVLMQSGVAASIPSTAPTPGTWAAHQEEEIGAPKHKAPDVEGLRKLPSSQWEAPGAPRVHRWGMAIDLSSCIGCNACAVACYAENNVAIVGVDRVAKRREMAWLRVERYWEGDGESLETRFLPNLCQHCDDAPCEPVCPVFATYHNPEGLNVQLYNRCVGTRYCSNNCPWRVRTFNYFDYPFPEPLNLQLNPDVTVRSKGVMEKCTFCTQRIREAKDRAQDEKRALADGDIVPACAQSCPTDAIVFGDLNDPDSRVTQLARLERGYRMFEELNTRPSITYLKKVTRGRRPSETAPQEADSVHHA